RDESQEKYPGKGDPPGLDKEKKTEVQPDSVSETPPDRPGVGKGRDESQERYPGRGEATGLEKQQDKAKENPGQEKATDENEKRNSKPEEKPANERSEGNRTQPEAKKDTAASARPGSNTEAESKRETAATERANDGKKSDDKSERRTAGEPAVSEPDAAAVPRLEVPSKELPPPDKCRVWIPGRAAGEQAKAGKCDDVESGAPAGSWVLYTPKHDRGVVHVKEIDARRAGVVTKVLSYEVASGKLIGEVRG
ncbi:MAG: hypothetical protein JSW51_06890, partial [Gemmatimonadota bacterium]